MPDIDLGEVRTHEFDDGFIVHVVDPGMGFLTPKNAVITVTSWLDRLTMGHDTCMVSGGLCGVDEINFRFRCTESFYCHW